MLYVARPKFILAALALTTVSTACFAWKMRLDGSSSPTEKLSVSGGHFMEPDVSMMNSTLGFT